MSTHERPPAPDRLTGWTPETGPALDDVADRLATGAIAVEGRLPWSSNLTFLVSITAPAGGGGGPDDNPPAGTHPLRAVYKPARGEQPLWDFPDGLHRREVAAFALSEALGWGLVPPTVDRDDGPFGPGSLQLFVDADYEQHYFTLLDGGGRDDRLQTVCAFDAAANNADRKSGHVLLGRDGRVWGIDHGLCFHPLPKLRTVIWDFAGDPVPSTLLADLARVRDDIPDGLARLLSEPERDALTGRIDALVDAGVFPEPADGRPPYPWPLV